MLPLRLSLFVFFSLALFPNASSLYRHQNEIPATQGLRPQDVSNFPSPRNTKRRVNEATTRVAQASNPLAQFLPVETYGSGGQSATSVAVADVNGDGKPDLVVANSCSASGTPCGPGNLAGTVAVLLGNGDGTFQNALTYGSGGEITSSVVVADVNGDGKPDLVLSNSCAANNSGCVNGPSGGTVSVLIGNGDGTFRSAVAYGSGGNGAASVAVADLNGDGKPDLLVVSNCGSCATGIEGQVGVLLGNGDGTFRSAVTYVTVGSDSNFVTVADVNGDGKPDALVTSACDNYAVCNPAGLIGAVAVFLGNGDGTFQPAVPYASGAPHATSVAVGDVNGDGKPDLVVSNYCDINGQYCFPTTSAYIGVLLGNGDGTFGSAVTCAIGAFLATSVALGDVNGDGIPDVLVSNMCSSRCANGSPGQVSVLLGNGDGTFQAPTLSAINLPLASIATADLTQDGALDVVVAGGNSVSILLNVGPGVLIQSSSNPAALGQSVTLTITCASVPGSAVATGTVTLKDGATTIGTNPLSNGMTNFTLTSLSAGTHNISALYSGDSNYKSVLSAVFPQVVSPPDFSIQPTPLTPSTLPHGQSATGQVTITSLYGFSGSTTLSCSVAPLTAMAPTCSLLPTSTTLAPGGSASVQLMVKTTASSSASLAIPRTKPGLRLTYAAWLFAPGIVLIGAKRVTPRSRRQTLWTIFLFCLVVAVFTFQTACGGGSSSSTTGGTPAGSYSIAISAVSGSITHTSSVNLTVK